MENNQYQYGNAPQYQTPPVNSEIPVEAIDPKLRPMKTSSYFGYFLLFSIPIVGQIFALIFSFNNRRIARRNFARGILLIQIILVVLQIIGMVTNLSFLQVYKSDEIPSLQDLYNYIIYRFILR